MLRLAERAGQKAHLTPARAINVSGCGFQQMVFLRRDG